MKKVYFIILLTAICLSSNKSMAQDVLVVQPGVGTLNAAVNQHGGNKIYQLKAGEWYGLNAPISNDGFHLQIIGSNPAEPGGMPATLQTGSDVNGTPFVQMFGANGEITLKNIYFVNADLSGQVANVFLTQSAENGRITVDSCILHPAAVVLGISATGGFTKTYFTNNLVVNFGHQLSPNDGWFFYYENATTGGPDTVLVENNTFVAMGMCLLSTGFAKFQDNNYINWNHNTFVMTKSQIDWSVAEKEYYWTNNLMFDVQTQPYFNHWQPMPGGDAKLPKPNLVYTDTLINESLPSSRINFVQYNAHYRAKGFYDFVKDEVNPYAIKNKLAQAYLFPLVWPKDSVNCREAQMFNSAGFPKFQYGNTLTDVDPEWNDKRIYDNEAKFIEWTKPATWIHGFGLPAGNYPPATQWPKWHWIPSGDISNNNVWPLFDGTYKNEQTLHGSIEVNIPLGDLNWYPDAKAAWTANKAKIDAHIKAGNTGQIDIGYLSAVKVSTSSIWVPDFSGANAIDGNGETYWASNHPGGQTNRQEWIALDLGVSKALSKITLTPRGDGAWFPIDFEIQTSSDGINWKTIPGHSFANYVNPGNATPIDFNFTTAVSTQYIRVLATKLSDFSSGFYMFHLTEIDYTEKTTSAINIVTDVFTLYPNPAQNILNISGAGNAEITIRSIEGRIVKFVQNASRIDISDMKSGIYLVTVKAENHVSTQKLIVK